MVGPATSFHDHKKYMMTIGIGGFGHHVHQPSSTIIVALIALKPFINL
jgi:hypothetical protein